MKRLHFDTINFTKQIYAKILKQGFVNPEDLLGWYHGCLPRGLNQFAAPKIDDLIKIYRDRIHQEDSLIDFGMAVENRIDHLNMLKTI